MSRLRALAALLPLALLLLPAPTVARAAAGDWPQYLHDAQRTAANPDETALSTANASKLVPLWSVATGGPIAAGATVVGGTAYFGSWDGNEYAVDAATGAVRWKTFLGITKAPSCFPPVAGVTSTATVQNGTVYVGGGDSNWYALDANTGTVLWSIFTGDNSVTGGHYNWSSPLLFNGFAYIGVASFGDCPLVPGQLLKVDLSTHQVVATFNAVAAGQVGGGIWTSPSLDVT
ncbi:MAG TPA: PQQ-binding-like beta-propeller repeat protein, partial [Candidatus Dormibacteraeota bacterium]|nr:PQQ-binding-like beta-propeller repeat protein [Candidatus Dormibacteraeota bacterium]